MNFVECGDKYGRPVVFVHGVGFGSWMWRVHMGHFSDYRCILPILPGHGHDDESCALTMDEHVDALAALIKKSCAGKKAYVVGHSFGGQLVVHLAARYPELVEGALVLSALMRTVKVAYYLFMRPFSRFLPSLFRFKWIRSLLASSFQVTDPAMREMFMTDLEGMNGTSFLSYTIANQECRVPEGLSESTVPIVCVCGSAEVVQMKRSLDDLRSSNPQMVQAVHIKGANHFYPWTRPELVSGVVREWLEKNAVQASRDVATL